MFRQLSIVISFLDEGRFCPRRFAVNAALLGAAPERHAETRYCAKLWKCSPVLQDLKKKDTLSKDADADWRTPPPAVCNFCFLVF